MWKKKPAKVGFFILGALMQQLKEKKPLRTRIYIDGYNLYYGCLKNTSLKWLDIQVLFEKQILPSILVTKDGKPATIELLPLSIKLFTAKILEKAAKADDSVACQVKYHNALKKKYNGRIELIEGYYSLIESKAKIVDVDKPNTWPKYCQEITVWKLEEKQSDVNLALQAYHDAVVGSVDHIVIVTNDTDIAPALKLIREHTKVIVGLVIPTKDHVRIPNAGLEDNAHWVRTHINKEELAASQLPRVIQGGRQPTAKPESWYPNQDIFQKILQLAKPVLGEKGKVFKWLEQPNSHLKNQKPIEMIETEDGANQVLEYIQDYIAKNAQSKVKDL
jgi:6-hydroxy-3-succinoylpyridine 3-monooxygenase